MADATFVQCKDYEHFKLAAVAVSNHYLRSFASNLIFFPGFLNPHLGKGMLGMSCIAVLPAFFAPLAL